MTTTWSTLLVAVPTYRRPAQLRRGLDEIVVQLWEVAGSAGRTVRATALIIDNDPDGSARPVAQAFPSELVGYVHEPTPGISAGRNRALHEARDCDLLVFIDDDERPRPGWLGALVSTWSASRPAAAAGWVSSTFDEPLEPWIEAGRFFDRPRRRTGTELAAAGAGNLLLDMHQMRGLGLRFDPRLGLTGGEDTLFTKQVVRRGGRIVWCDEAVADDVVPAERATRAWVLKRAWRTGVTASVVDLYAADTTVQRRIVAVRATGQGSARVVGGAVRYLLGTLSRSLRWQAGGLRTVQRGRGMLAGVRGVSYEEYGRSD